ncbi:uncharacterized protein AB675_836 [Cyphellophora attinorum]|uniref:Uncharacterized protein n=1 Tax=Cyphellophora attinorum TaxID=1664694 RepID=A0A0N1P3X2_9EURO|nr:uncharacterized protein AB675_836 [Phialophora attinorum]KPI45967.1 hypothetical protein AB675_836 [Phialophora attinorum]
MAGMDAHEALLERRSHIGFDKVLYNGERGRLMRAMRPDERKILKAAEHATAQANLNLNNQSTITKTGAKPTFLALPVEVRWLIYNHLSGCQRKINLFSTKRSPFFRSWVSRFPDLSLVCQQLKAEVDRHFLETQTYAFQNVPAVKRWCNKDQVKVSTMRHVEFCFNTPMLLMNVTSTREGFKNLKELTIRRTWTWKSDLTCTDRESEDHVRQSYLPHLREDAGWFQSQGDISNNMLLVWRQPEIVLHCLPQFQTGVIEWAPTPEEWRNGIYSVRFRVHDFKPSHHAQLDTKRWKPIDLTRSRTISEITFMILSRSSPERQSVGKFFREVPG